MDISCILLHILILSACYGGGDGGVGRGSHDICHDKHTKDLCIQKAIENIGSALDEHLCYAFKDVNCSHHILIHDEMICATDGKTYRNHCEYASARCAQILDKHNYEYHSHVLRNPLGIVSHSACVVSTKRPTTPFLGVSTTNMPIVNTNTGPDVSTVSVVSVLKSVFCKNVWSINCGQDFSIVCGSDGKYYPNECELLKWQCDNPLLRKASDTSVCG